MIVHHSKDIQNEGGSALVYILIAIALLAALTFTFMEPSSQQTSSQNSFKTVSALQGQADMIRSAMQECVLSYPKGDNTIDNSGTGTDEGARDNYPIKPNSTHYDVGDRASDRFVKNMRCPGNNGGVGSENDHAVIFGGRSGKFLPPAPDLFKDWEIYNGVDGVFFWNSTDKTDAFIETGLTKLEGNFSDCEADVIDATGGAVNLDSDSAVECPDDHYCFRVRMLTLGTAVWNVGSSDNGSCP